MTTIKKAIVAVCSITTFCLCLGCAAVSADSPKNNSGSAVSTSSPNLAPLSTENQSIPQSDCEITGTPLSPEQLIDYSLDCQWSENYVDTYDAGTFLDSLNNPQIKSAYCKAVALVRQFNTDNIEPSEAVDVKNRAYLLVNTENSAYPRRYMESGYTYDSFMSALGEVFTDSMLNVMLNRIDVFYSYNSELWYAGATLTGNPGEVHREYELISQTDTEVRFKRTMFSVPIGEEVTEYDPEKRDDYIKTSVEFRFIFTDNRWKAAEFLNLQNPDGEFYYI